MKQERVWPTVLVGWSLVSVLLTLVSARAIAHLWFPDPDDAMRLLEVRDWLNGQSWWDVSQHRLWFGHFAMHWSRLVDLPIAGLLVVLDPLLGTATATRVVMVTVPLVTLLTVMALGADLTRRLAGIERARLVMLLVPLSVPLLIQLRPLRIDHHGWQIACALLAMCALMAKPTWRSGAVIGTALAVLLTISLEGLPVTVVILGVCMLAWVWAPARRAQPLTAIWVLSAVVAALHLATRGPAIFAPACDAVSPVWIAALGCATFGATIAMLWPRAGLMLRLGLLVLAAAAALAALIIIAPACVSGPFGQLDPLVRRFWYNAVLEGLPVWQQTPAWALNMIGLPAVALVGSFFAWRASHGDARLNWTMMLAISTSAFLLSLLVMRTSGTANALALPGSAWALHAMLRRARAIHAGIWRILATVAAFLAAAPGLAASILFGVPLSGENGSALATARAHRPLCHNGHEVADLAYLPRSRLFAPIDVTPDMIAWTGHSAIAGGYHRNSAAIHDVLATFMASPIAAHRSVLASGARYVVGCPGENETETYKKYAPNGFWARLERGERFDWLQPVIIPGSPVLAWKVVGR